jgi:hypothetical protein
LWKPPAGWLGASRAQFFRDISARRVQAMTSRLSRTHRSGLHSARWSLLSKITAKDAKRVRKGRKENHTKVFVALFAVFLATFAVK